MIVARIAAILVGLTIPIDNCDDRIQPVCRDDVLGVNFNLQSGASDSFHSVVVVNRSGRTAAQFGLILDKPAIMHRNRGGCPARVFRSRQEAFQLRA